MKYRVFIKGKENVNYIGFEIASTTKRYRKLVVDNQYAMTYGTAAYYCSGELCIED